MLNKIWLVQAVRSRVGDGALTRLVESLKKDISLCGHFTVIELRRIRMRQLAAH
jgi:hypothetical protein